MELLWEKEGTPQASTALLERRQHYSNKTASVYRNRNRPVKPCRLRCSEQSTGWFTPHKRGEPSLVRARVLAHPLLSPTTPAAFVSNVAKVHTSKRGQATRCCACPSATQSGRRWLVGGDAGWLARWCRSVTVGLLLKVLGCLLKSDAMALKCSEHRASTH